MNTTFDFDIMMDELYDKLFFAIRDGLAPHNDPQFLQLCIAVIDYRNKSNRLYRTYAIDYVNNYVNERKKNN